MKTAFHFLKSVLVTSLVLTTLGTGLCAEETAASVKSYLLKKLEKVNAAAEEFLKNSEAYAALVAANGGSVGEAAFKANPKEVEKLVSRMQENYKAMDSFGYETVEGIVAGVPSMADYDIYLDAGLAASEGPENVANVILDMGNGKKIDKQGALFTYIIEPMLWAGNERWVTPVDGGKKLLPRPEVLSAACKGRSQEAWRASRRCQGVERVGKRLFWGHGGDDADAIGLF